MSGVRFGPLEIAYDFPAITREQIEAGPANIWRYKALLPVPDDIEQSPNMEPGYTRLLRANNLGRALGIDNLWVKDDSTNPRTPLRPRRGVRPQRRHRVPQQGLRLPLHRQPGQRGRRGGGPAGIKTVVFIPSNLEKPKQVNSAVYTDSLVAVDGNYDDVNRLASEIAGRRTAGRSSTSTSAPTTPRAPRRSATRSPSSSAGACPTRS